MRWVMATIGSTPTIAVRPFRVWIDRKSSRTLRRIARPSLAAALNREQAWRGRGDELVGLSEVGAEKLAEIDVESHPGSAREAFKSARVSLRIASGSNGLVMKLEAPAAERVRDECGHRRAS